MAFIRPFEGIGDPFKHRAGPNLLAEAAAMAAGAAQRPQPQQLLVADTRRIEPVGLRREGNLRQGRDKGKKRKRGAECGADQPITRSWIATQ